MRVLVFNEHHAEQDYLALCVSQSAHRTFLAFCCAPFRSKLVYGFAAAFHHALRVHSHHFKALFYVHFVRLEVVFERAGIFELDSSFLRLRLHTKVVSEPVEIPVNLILDVVLGNLRLVKPRQISEDLLFIL